MFYSWFNLSILLFPVISSKVPDLQLLTPSSGLCSQLWGADSSSLVGNFKERVFSPHSCPSQCLHGLGQIICSHFAAFSRGVFGASPPWRRRFFSSTNKRPGVDSQAAVPTVGFGIQSEMLKGRYLHLCLNPHTNQIMGSICLN